jgi:DNA polymerase-3 subunit alpha
MVKEKEKFIAGAQTQGYRAEDADRIFEILVPFAGYGFNKAHAAAYSVLAYQTAWLKANFPAEFMAANLSNEIHSADKDKLSVCINEAGKMGISLDPPDINRSDKLFSVVEGRIVYGFLGIKGIGDIPADEIVACRREGPYQNFMNFLNRVDIKTVGKKTVELLIQTGAFDTMGQSREILQGNLERAVDYAQNIKDESKYGQSSLFGETEEKTYASFTFDPFPEKSREEKLKLEKDLTGFYLSGHPMDDCREAWEKFVRLDLGSLEAAPPGNYTLIGILKNLKPIVSKGGKAMAFATLADYRGEVDLVFFEEVWIKYRDRIKEDDKIALKGKLDVKRGKPAIQAETVLEPEKLKIPELVESFCSQPLDKYRDAWRRLVKLDLANTSAAAEDEYTLIGTISSLRQIQDKNGKPMAFGSLSDYRGEIELVFFGKTWEACQGKITEGKPAALKGRLDKKRERPSLRVGSLLDLERLGRKAEKMAETGNTANETAVIDNTAAIPAAAALPVAADRRSPLPPAAPLSPPPQASGGAPGASPMEPRWRELHIRLECTAAQREEDLLPLRDQLIENPGACQVFIHVPVSPPASEGETVIRTANQISAAATTASIDALKQCLGVAEVWGE